MSKGSPRFEMIGVTRKCVCKFFMFVFLLVYMCVEVKIKGLIKAYCGRNKELLKFLKRLIYKN